MRKSVRGGSTDSTTSSSSTKTGEGGEGDGELGNCRAGGERRDVDATAGSDREIIGDSGSTSLRRRIVSSQINSDKGETHSVRMASSAVSLTGVGSSRSTLPSLMKLNSGRAAIDCRGIFTADRLLDKLTLSSGLGDGAELDESAEVAMLLGESINPTSDLVQQKGKRRADWRYRADLNAMSRWSWRRGVVAVSSGAQSTYWRA